MKPYKACSCRDPATGRLLGKKCPDLSKRNHGKWYVRYEAPPKATGTRRRPRIGPYDTEREAKNAVIEVLGQAAKTGHRGEGELKPSTLESESEAIELYFKPGLGHIQLTDLRDHQIRDLYVEMRKINRPGEDAHPSDLLRRLLEARAAQKGRRISTRTLSESRIRRIHAVLTAALNDAVDAGYLAVNPAARIFKSTASRKKGRIKPLLWTQERTEYWEETGAIPGKVMVWTAGQCGAFLDFAEVTGERLYPLLHLAAYWGPRRGELIGLERHDLSVETRLLHIRQAQADDELEEPKSDKSNRRIRFDEDTASVLRAWTKSQREERLRWGPAYTDSGRVFTYEDGRALQPEYVSSRFNLLTDRYRAIRRRYYEEKRSVTWIARRHRVPDEAVKIALATSLPPVRFHDLRHGAATMLRAAGVPIKVISDILGHASTAFTDDVYTAVADELAEQAARAISAFVPRRGHQGENGHGIQLEPSLCPPDANHVR